MASASFSEVFTLTAEHRQAITDQLIQQIKDHIVDLGNSIEKHNESLTKDINSESKATILLARGTLFKLEVDEFERYLLESMINSIERVESTEEKLAKILFFSGDALLRTNDYSEKAIIRCLEKLNEFLTNAYYKAYFENRN